MGWLATFLMGLVLGLLGGGGGILTVPILVGFFGLSATAATGGSLFVVGLTGAVGATQGILKKQAEIAPAIMLAIPSMFGAVLARSVLVPAIPDRMIGLSKDQILLGAFAILMFVVGVSMLVPKNDKGEANRSWIAIAGLGFLIGILSGTLGAGGGFLILPVLTLLLKVEMEKAIPTSLLVICVQSLGGFLGEIGKPVDWSLLTSVAGVALIGMLFGLLLRKHAPRKTLQLAFAYLVFAVAVWMFVKIL